MEGIFSMHCSLSAYQVSCWPIFFFENYPVRIFWWGNIGVLSVSAAIGALIITQNFLIIGFIMLIPHNVNFLMYGY